MCGCQRMSTRLLADDHVVLLQVVVNTPCAWSNFLPSPLCLGGFHLFEDQFRHQAFPQERQCLALVVKCWLEHCVSAVLPLSLLSLCSKMPRACCQVLVEALSESCGCCCGCACQRLQSVIFGANRGVGSLSKSARSPFSQMIFEMQSAGTWLCTIVAFDFACQNRNPCSCAWDNFTQ